MTDKQRRTLKQLSMRLLIWVGLCAVGMSSLLVSADAYAQASTAASTTLSNVEAANGGLQVESRDGALILEWQGNVQSANASVDGTLEAEPEVSYGGYLLPIQTLLVELPSGQAPGNAIAAVAVQGMSSTPYAGTLTAAPAAVPPALDWESSPLTQPYIEPALPTSPIFVMAEGMQRGRHLATLGFSPIYQDPNTGEILHVDSFNAAVAGASVVARDAEFSDATANPETDSRFAPVAAFAAATGPTNPLANTNAYKLFVSNAGMQQLSGAELANAGLVNPQASKLALFYQGTEIPLHLIDGNSNNVLEAGDYIRFFAPTAGDAWNAEGVYWLAIGSQNGLRISPRTVPAGAAQARNTAFEVGRYAEYTAYESTVAGGDEDNWFLANLRAETDSVDFPVTLTHQLPLNGNLPTVLTLNVTPYRLGSDQNVLHRLKLSAGGYSHSDDNDDWVVNFSGHNPFVNQSRTFTLTTAADKWTIALQKESSDRGVMFDTIDYLLPVQLSFADKGAIFQGVDGTWRYQLSGTPTSVTGGRALYDITDPTLPKLLSIPAGASFEFEDGPAVHRYLLTGNGTLFTPTIAAHTPVNLGAPGAAHTLYIAPKEFHAALQPLVDLRKSQGYKVSVVDVNSIYDAWSYGMVDAEAIRSFLRYAVGNWSPAPLAAVLVGDTTWDPLNYLGFDNASFIPPYIANVDPWLKYVPCDSCYGQLDGNNPTDEVGFMVDLWIGRFPVVNEGEVTTIVNKIVNYENATDNNALWRQASLQIADDDVQPDNTIDSAGPFTESAEKGVALMPKGISHLRNYYLAATDLSATATTKLNLKEGETLLGLDYKNSLLDLLNVLKGWFVKDPVQAMQRSIDLMNSGVGLVTYTGHANHWQWARTVLSGDNKWLFGLWEVGRLGNRDMPFIALSMTCFTSQFHVPAGNHFTLDEHLLLHGNGGAVAVWGPSGFSVVPAHDSLQKGFHELLWNSPRQRAKLGALTEAGYQAILASGSNLDVNKSFVFLGDPFTSARIAPNDNIYMPKVRNQN